MTTMNVTTGNDIIDTKLDVLIMSIGDNNIPLVKMMMSDLLEMSSTNKELTSWVITPVNITLLHNLLVEHMGITPRGLKVAVRNKPHHMRGILFFKAMNNAVQRLD